MATITIDGKEVPFEQGDTIIRAAHRQGMEIPHYCWHPGLSVAANCRMCLVEIRSGRQMNMPILKWDSGKSSFVPDTKPKLQPACQMAATEGMEVVTKSDHVKEAQASVQEFLLLNHPVDCPICDQAGECRLQDYWLEHQTTLKRKQSEPVHKPKAVRFGPTIVYDAERCIMCTRCIRVCDELAGDHVLDMRQRGNKNEIFVAPGRELDHNYTLMTEHVCPVGALTSKDFRFKARVWFLKTKDSVCSGCATGCNSHVDYDPRYNQVQRLRPRDNEQVNKHWMCDKGMVSYHEVHEGRVLMPLSSGQVGERTETSWANAESAVLKTLKGANGDRVAVVLSALHSTEDNWGLAQLAQALGAKHYLAARPDWKGDNVLMHNDHNPNRRGAQHVANTVLGGESQNVATLVRALQAGEIDTVVSLGPTTEGEAELAQYLTQHPGKATLIALTANQGPLSDAAQHVIPVASWAEAPGSYINAQGLSQNYQAAIPAQGQILPTWLRCMNWHEAIKGGRPAATLADVRNALGTLGTAPPVSPEPQAQAGGL